MRHNMDQQDASNISVLLVDNHAAFLSIAATFVQWHEELVVAGTCSGCHEALRQAALLRPQMILIDLDMPDESGLDAIARLRAALPATGIIAWSLWAASAYEQAAVAVGADAVVSKTEIVSSLLPAIRRVAQKHEFLPRPSSKGRRHA